MYDVLVTNLCSLYPIEADLLPPTQPNQTKLMYQKQNLIHVTIETLYGVQAIVITLILKLMLIMEV